MPIAVTEDHEALRTTALRWAQTHCPPSVPRGVAETPPAARVRGPARRVGEDGRPGLARPPPGRGAGGPGLHPGRAGRGARGAGARPPSRSRPADRAGVRRAGPPAAGAGAPCRRSGGAAWPTGPSRPPWRSARRRTPGGRSTTGRWSSRAPCGPVLGLPTARLVLIPLDGGGEGTRWLLLDRATLGDAVGVEALPALDGTRALGQLTVAGAGGVTVPRSEQVMVADADVRGLALTLAAAESAGIARWCLQTASEYAKVRVQFGRPDRPVPGGQARAGRHAGGRRAVRRGGLGRGGGLERGRRRRRWTRRAIAT